MFISFCLILCFLSIGNDRGMFRLDKRTGNLTVAGILDREKDSIFKLRIKAFELRQPESFEIAQLRVRLSNRVMYIQNLVLDMSHFRVNKFGNEVNQW